MSEYRQLQPGMLLGENTSAVQPQSDFGMRDFSYTDGGLVDTGYRQAGPEYRQLPQDTGGMRPAAAGPEYGDYQVEVAAPAGPWRTQDLGAPTTSGYRDTGGLRTATPQALHGHRTDSAPASSGRSDTYRTTAPDILDRRTREHGKRPWGKIGVAVGAVALAAVTVASGLLGSRGHSEAHPGPGPQPTVAAKAHPKWWRPIRQGNTLKLENARWDAQHDMTTAVMQAKNSTEAIINYTDEDDKGRYLVAGCTAYMGEDAGGNPALRMAAHCVRGSADHAAFPNYMVEINDGGSAQQVFVDTYKAPASYDRFTDAYIGSPSDDEATVRPYTDDWADAGESVHYTPNDITNIHPLKNKLGKAAVGTLLFSWGMRPAEGAMRLPPSSATMQAFVVAGYADNGNRQILIPLDQRNPKQNEGNSGSAIIDDEAAVSSTFIISGRGNAQYIRRLTGRSILGGKHEKIDEQNITFVIGETNNQDNLRQVDAAPAAKPAFPSHVPRIKVPA